MFKKYIYLVAVLLLVVDVAKAQQTADTVLTLQQCIDLAIQNNLTVKKSETQMERDRIYWNQARQNLLPSFSGDINHSKNFGRSLDPTSYTYVNQQITSGTYSLNSDLTVFNGLNLMNSIKQTALAYQAGKLDFQQAKNDITINVITTYLQVLQSEDQATQTATQIDVSQKQVDRLKILDNEGSISASVLADLRGTLATNKLSLIDAKNAMYAAKLNLLQLMNTPYNKDVKLQRLSAGELPGQYTLTADQVYNSALTGLPLVQAADLRLKSSEKAVAATKGLLFPSLALSGGLSSNYSSFDTRSYDTQIRNNYSYGLGLGLHIPILGGFQRKNAVSLAKLDMLDARYTTETTKVQLKKNVDQAYIDMTSAYERYQTLVEQVDAYAESFHIAEIKFDAGVLTSVDFIIVKGNMDRAKISLIGARYDYFIRTKILDYYQGKLAL